MHLIASSAVSELANRLHCPTEEMLPIAQLERQAYKRPPNVRFKVVSNSKSHSHVTGQKTDAEPSGLITKTDDPFRGSVTDIYNHPP